MGVAYLPEKSLGADVWVGVLADIRDLLSENTEWCDEAIFGCASVEIGLALGREVKAHYGRSGNRNG